MSCRILFLSVVIQLMLSGCFSSRVKEPQDKITTLRRNESRSVKAESIRGVRARLLRKTGRTANFSLVCDGRFFVKSARERIVERAGRCEKAFGFFPGFYSMSESADGNNYAKGVAMCGWIVLENAATAFVPTFFSLFYGPFSEYFNGGRQCSEALPRRDLWAVTNGVGSIRGARSSANGNLARKTSILTCCPAIRFLRAGKPMPARPTRSRFRFPSERTKAVSRWK